MYSFKYKQEKIKELEKLGQFNTELFEHDLSNCAVDDEKFEYLPNNFGFKTLSAFVRGFMFCLGPIVNSFGFGLKIKGRKNIKNLKSAISVSNHVLNLDSLIVRQGLLGHKMYVTAAPFNCPKSFAGTILKSGGVLPISCELKGSRKMQNAISECLQKGHFVHFYPEQALWTCYEKPRPVKRGAFHYASLNNVPIVPMFLCFRKASFIRRMLGSKRKMVTLVIEKPIYPKENCLPKENSIYLMEETSKCWQKIYDEFYGIGQ